MKKKKRLHSQKRMQNKSLVSIEILLKFFDVERPVNSFKRLAEIWFVADIWAFLPSETNKFS